MDIYHIKDRYKENNGRTYFLKNNFFIRKEFISFFLWDHMFFIYFLLLLYEDKCGGDVAMLAMNLCM